MTADYHTHTAFSFDSETEPEKLVLSAIERGITSLAITDHLDIDCSDYGLINEIDHKKRREIVFGLKDKYKGKIDVLYGLELGEPYNRKAEAEKLLADEKYEFVIGSVHNLKCVPDFCYFKYERMEDEVLCNLLSRYLDDNMKITEFDGIDTVGHVTYPLRYVSLAGKKFDISRFFEKYEELFKKIIDKDMALEVNTSTLYKGLGFTMPNLDILKLYKDVGGKKITVGSDAHLAENVGKGIKEAYEMLKSVGFDSVTVKKDGRTIEEKI